MKINTIIKEVEKRIDYLQTKKDKLCTLEIPISKRNQKEYEIKQELYILRNMLHEYYKENLKES